MDRRLDSSRAFDVQKDVGYSAGICRGPRHCASEMHVIYVRLGDWHNEHLSI